MMISRTLLSGIQSAQVRFEKSAEKVVDAFSAFEQPEQATPVAPVNGVQAIGVGSTAFAAGEEAFIEETVNMTTASFAYKANINAFKAWNKTTENVLKELTA